MQQSLGVSSTLCGGRAGDLPLSFSQQRLWFLDQLAPGSTAYNVSRVLRLSGRLNVEALQKALDAIVARHDVLRTVFVSADGNPAQVVQEAAFLELPVVDLGRYSKETREEEAMRLVGAEAQRPFDLSKDLMLRGVLIRLEEEEHVLVVVMHHIASDGWSMAILFEELSAFYEAFCTGKTARLSRLPIQYVDFAIWQREWLQGEVLESQLRYWRKQLEGAPRVLELPSDRPRPAVQTFRGARQSLTLSSGLSEKLKRLSRTEGASLFMTLLAAFQALLSRYTRQQEVLVGTPIAGRNRAETERMIGFFVNTLVLRANLSGDPTFREFLRNVRSTCLDAYTHQDLPFENLVKELQLERDMSHNPLFQVMFVLQNAPLPRLELPGLNLTSFEVDSGTAKFDLTLSMVDKGETLVGWLHYNTDLFDGTTIDRLLGHYQMLLEGVVVEADRKISELPLLTEKELQQIIVEWNDTGREYPKHKCIHHLFEEQAARTPEALAVVYGKQQLTYQQINTRANQLARHLRSLGVRPEVMVGICLESSVEMVVGLLGIFKAGGTYVPLDPNYPKERLAYLVKDSKVSVLLTREKWRKELADLLTQEENERFPKTRNRQSEFPHPALVCLDRDWEVIARETDENPVSNVRAENLAYVIYTSGSTGQPKGVMIEHRSLLNYLCWVNESLLGELVHVVPMVSRLSFDASLKQVFAPLLRGDEVWIIEGDVFAKSDALLQTLGQRTQVGLNCVPSLWKSILDSSEVCRAVVPSKSLTNLFVGGEQLNKELVARSLAALPDLHIWNLYGPTETTANASAARIVSEEHVSIGRPLANVQIYLLDQHQNPVPIGVPGELHVGGDGLARGYLDRPELTAQKFIPNPYSEIPGSRLYTTGDVARYLPDGNIEYLGRVDHQVKLCGFRIEPGEIEAALEENPAVMQALVMVREDGFKKKHLVAYIVPKQEQNGLVGELRIYLKQKLPDYMVPSVFVALDKLPMTPNGKLDHRALPAPDWERPELESFYVAPRTSVEELLAVIWAEVLGIERVGIHDNFFDLGGHSLLAMKLSSRMSAALRRDVSVRSLFFSPNIAALSEALMSFPALEDGSAAIDLPHREAGESSLRSEPSPLQPSSPHLKIERRSLLSLVGTGKIAAVDAAALGYLSDSILTDTDVTRDEIIHDWYEDLPTLSAITEVSLGRIGIITLPHFGSDLYNNQENLVDVVVEALELAGQIGARVVSLTGLIPSATDYGHAVAKRIAKRQDLPKITTGHATTAATVVLAARRVLEESGRDLRGNRVGFLGLGSIGTAVLRLMLRCLPHPAEIILCDIYGKLNSLESIRKELADELGFRGPVRVLEATGGVPEEFYNSTLIVGATNVPEVLNMELVRAGTLIVDDSGPHCFNTEDAVRRFLSQKDVLFSEGGVLQSPDTVTRLRYLPRRAEQKAAKFYKEVLARYHPFQITGCLLSALLSSRYENLKPTLGITDDRESLLHYKKLVSLGFRAADLHCGGFILPPEHIQKFRRRLNDTGMTERIG